MLVAQSLEECQRSTVWNPEHFNGRGLPRGGYETAVYWCRGDRKGEWLDKGAMLDASEALGHSRLSVVGEHYIR